MLSSTHTQYTHYFAVHMFGSCGINPSC